MNEHTGSIRNPLSQVNFSMTPHSEPIFGTHNGSSAQSLKSGIKTEPVSKKKTISSFNESEEESEYVKTFKKALAEVIAENEEVNM